MSSSDKDLLSKGLDFAIPPKQIDYSNFMTEFENNLSGEEINTL